MNLEPSGVAVLGAGVAGLAGARALHARDFEVTVFEARDQLGGVWANNYRALRVLEPNCVYGYPDWPWPEGSELFPSASQVREYLASYARHFGIYDRIRFGSRITGASPQDSGGWRIEYQDTQGSHAEVFDFFVIAPGMFNIPKIPDWPGRDKFAGELIHSSQYRDPEQVRNKRVAIVGFSRSAMDIAVNIVDDAAAVSIVHRSVRWPVPERILGLIRNHLLLFSRWPTYFAPPWIRPTRTGNFLHGIGKPLVAGFWKFFELLLAAQFRLRSRGLLPDRPIRLDLFTNLYITPPSFFRHLGDGRIRDQRSEIEAFDSDGLLLENGERVDADVVISATGWRQDYDFLADDTRNRIHDADGMHLYRHMVHPDLAGFGFVGGVQGINSATCYAVQSAWLAGVFAGDVKLPSADAQRAEIEALRQWNREFVTPRPNRSQILNLHQIPYLDDLIADLGRNPVRKPFLLNQFAPYRSVDYRDLFTRAAD